MPNLINGWKANRELIDDHYVSEVHGQVEFRELDRTGRCEATFRLTDEALAVRPVATGPHQISWCAEKKCSDGAILQDRQERVDLHIIELKGQLDNKQFNKVRMQAQGMFTNALALARTVGVANFGEITCYLTHTGNLIDYSQTPSPILLKVAAKGNEAAAAHDWAHQQISLPFGIIAPLVVVARVVGATTVDFGTI